MSISIKTNKEYSSLMEPLHEDEYIQLRKSIEEHGQWIPIICNDIGEIIDGHHRAKACKELGIEPDVITKSWKTKLDEKIFALECNARRRHLDYSSKHRIYMALLPMYEERAKNRQKMAGGKEKQFSGSKPTPAEKYSKLSSTQAATAAGLSKSTADRMDYVYQNKPEIYQKIGSGDGKISPNKAARMVKSEITKIEKLKKLHAKALNVPAHFILKNKRFQDSDTKPNSVDLIITDPPYTAQDVKPKSGDSIFLELGKFANHTLRDGGSMVTLIGHYYLDIGIEEIKSSGLDYHWIISLQHSGQSTTNHDRRALISWKPMLWFTKGRYTGEYVSDVIHSETPEKEYHEWAQSTKEAEHCIRRMTVPNGVVCDPCMGSGAFGVAAKKLGRTFIGCESDKDSFDVARKLLSS